MRKIGTAKVKDIRTFASGMLSPDYWEVKARGEYYDDDKETDWKSIEYARNIKNSMEFAANNNSDRKLFDLFRIRDRKYVVESLISICEMADDLGLSLDVYYSDDTVSLIGYCYKEYYYVFIPTQYLDITLLKDYSDIPVSRLLSITQDNLPAAIDLPALETDFSVNGMNQALEEKRTEISRTKESIKKLEQEKEAELDRIKLELEKKYKSILSELDRKKEELELAKEKLTAQLFMMDTQIYAIRCFMGETIQFKKISSGQNAPDDEPVVLYQKLRYMDEEMGKIAAIYNFGEEDFDLLENLLKHRADIREFFMPHGRSVSLVRLSADGKIYEWNTQAEVAGKSISVSSVLDGVRKYHGNRIGIMVRNGENCYIGWTEADRISIQNGDVFNKPDTKIEQISSTEEDKYKYYSEDTIRQLKKKEADAERAQIASRYFIFSILQGLAKENGIMPIPNGSFLHPDGKNVIFSMADNWLSDNRYGSLEDILTHTFGEGKIRKGDMILTLRALSAEGRTYDTYSNDRGRGYKNRTHDVHVSDNSIYPINLVEADEYWYTCYKTRVFDEMRKECRRGRTDEVSLPNDAFDIHEEKITKYNYFVSLEKEENWRRSWYKNNGHDDGYRSRANFQLSNKEFIHLTFLSSLHIEYVIFNKKAVCHSVSGSKVNFSYMLPYLNHALEYLREREAREAEIINAFTSASIETVPEWQVKLSEWKLENNVHEITEYQAKRFAKFLSLT